MEDQELFHRVKSLLDGGTAAALATVVETRGSTPQKVGAKMAVLADGQMFGTVGGGCVESKAKSACLAALLRSKRVELVEVTLTDDVGLRDGDVCGGTMMILVEPFFP